MRYREILETVYDSYDDMWEEERSHKLNELEDYNSMKRSGSFDFGGQSVYSLEGSPEVVKNFYFAANQVKSLQYGPKKVDGDFDCSENSLTSFEHGPLDVETFTCQNNPITSLKGSPQRVSDYSVTGTNVNLHSYEGIPTTAGAITVPLIGNGSLKVIDGVFHNVDWLCLAISPNQHIANVLSLFKMSGFHYISFCDHDGRPIEQKATEILNNFLPMGKKGLMQCQSELIKAGLKDWAKL